MENAVQKFDFKGHAVRMEEKNGEIWFMAKDVCDILGIKNARKTTSDLGEDETTSLLVTLSDGKPHWVNGVSEAGLYALIFKSRKPEAEQFTHWVTHKVLPSIRKTGGYVHPTLLEAKESPALLQSVQALSNGIDKLHQVQQHFDTRVIGVAPLKDLIEETVRQCLPELNRQNERIEKLIDISGVLTELLRELVKKDG